jgi:hypothetical protein
VVFEQCLGRARRRPDADGLPVRILTDASYGAPAFIEQNGSVFNVSVNASPRPDCGADEIHSQYEAVGLILKNL